MKPQKTVLRYAGGKSRAVKKITPFVEPYDTIVSPFLGGGSLEVHWASMGKRVIGSDVFDLLINFWACLLEDRNKVADYMSEIKPTEEEYRLIKEELIQTPEVQEMLKDWTTDFYKRTPRSIEKFKLAAYYYFNHNCSYGPGFLGWASKLYMKQEKWDKTIEKIRDFKCPTLEVHRRGFQKAIEQHPTDFLYLDPPYYLQADADNKMLGGIYPMKNIPVHHSTFDHEKLRDMLLDHEGDFVLSYNNCETIRDWYSDFELFYPEWHYSMDIGETRIGKNRKERTAATCLTEHEILCQHIDDLGKFYKDNASDEAPLKNIKNAVAALKTIRHDIMKKESHELLIVKRKKDTTNE